MNCLSVVFQGNYIAEYQGGLVCGEGCVCGDALYSTYLQQWAFLDHEWLVVYLIHVIMHLITVIRNADIWYGDSWASWWIYYKSYEEGVTVYLLLDLA